MVLTGDGGDELFAGYDRIAVNMKAERYRRWFNHQPGKVGLQFIEESASPFVSNSIIRKIVTFSRLARGNFEDVLIKMSSICLDSWMSI